MKVHYNSFPMKVIGLFYHRLIAITFGSHVFTKYKTATAYTLNHEECHVKQYAKYGFFGFLIRYVWECLKHGYSGCRFEEEARKYGTWPKEVRDRYQVQ